MRIITGFHAVEESLRAADKTKNPPMTVLFSKAGPRVKKICAFAEENGVVCRQVPDAELDRLVAHLPETARDHRGIVLQIEQEDAAPDASVSFDTFIAEQTGKTGNSVVVLLDSITDPHNVGAITRSCDQFGVDLLVLPSRNSAKDSEVVARASAGASAWVPVSVVPNLVRAAAQLKAAGYWIYGADAGGKAAPECSLSGKTALILGSEGSGIGRLLKEQCDAIISIPTCGRLDSLNVSVAAGILLYEIAGQNGGSK